MKLAKKKYGNVIACYRPGTSDERVLTEVVDKHCYAKPSLGFDVEHSEHWLDLGANIGAFGIYCLIKGATAECYEPDNDCFKVLRKNIPANWEAYPFAVTAHDVDRRDFYVSRKEGQHTRGTVLQKGLVRLVGRVPNWYAASFRAHSFDGVKMDIEGSEGGIIDKWFLPKCDKLVLEYHLSRDPSAANLALRLDMLRAHFKHVKYPDELDRLLKSGQPNFKTFFDRNIYCWGAK